MYKINEYRQKLLKNFNIDLDPVSAKGNILSLSDGTFVYDYLAQYGALPFGHNPDFLNKVVIDFLQTNQANLIQPSISNVVEQFANRLIELVNSERYSRCIMTNSGAETVEVAFKLARIKTGRAKILSVVKGFHGKTFAALSASGSKRFKKPFIHDEAHYDYIELNQIEDLEEKLRTKQYAAFIIEPILGEGGMIPATPDFLRQAVSLCKKYGTMSIFDEIQTGLGRIGEICMAKYYEIYPDCILFSKALGGGLVPVGAAIYREKFYTFNFDKKHSSTFSNNALAATIALTVLNFLHAEDSSIYQNVRTLSEYLDEQIDRLLVDYAQIIKFNGAGLMRSFEFYDSTADKNILINFSQNNGSLAYIICGYLLSRHQVFMMPLLSKPCSIRFEPPLTINKSDIDRFIYALEEVCVIIQNGRYDLLFSHLIKINFEALPASTEHYPVSFVADTLIADCQFNPENSHLKAGKKFAFFIHTTSIEDLINSFPYSIKKNFNDDQLNQLADKILAIARTDPSPDLATFFTVYNNQRYADGMFIFSPLSPQDMIWLSPQDRLDLMLEYLEVAQHHGAEFIGLGAYTSVISNGGETILPFTQHIHLTNGNSLTALSTVESIFSMIEGIDVSMQYAVIVGARGSVGKLTVAGLAHQYGQLILVGRSGSEVRIKQEVLPYLIESCCETEYQIMPGSFFDKLRKYLNTTQGQLRNIDQLAEDLVQLGLSIEFDYQLAFTKADIVISATSEGKAFLNTQYLKKSSLVFDVARPFDFIEGHNVKIYEGGLVSQPNPVFYSDCNMVRVAAGINLACLSETIALSLNGMDEHQSIGKSVPFKKAHRILNIAKMQGFNPINYSEK